MSAHGWENQEAGYQAMSRGRVSHGETVILTPEEKAALESMDLLRDPVDQRPFDCTGKFRELRAVQTIPQLKPVRRLRRRRQQERAERARKERSNRKSERVIGLWTRLFGTLFFWKPRQAS